MRHHHVDLSGATEFVHFVDDDRAVARTEACVHHQCGAGANDDANVGNGASIEIGDRPHVVSQLDGRILTNQGRGRLLGSNVSAAGKQEAWKEEETDSAAHAGILSLPPHRVDDISVTSTSCPSVRPALQYPVL